MSGGEYSRVLARVAAAQLAELAGFEAAHESAVDVLADLLQRYLSNVCVGAHDYAELAGRTHANTLDALLALEDMGTTPDELDNYAGLLLKSGSVPFAHVVPRYPVLQQAPSAPTFQDRHEPHPAHIPAFLPAFPDAHTYQHTPAFQGHEADAQRARKAVLEGKQQAEEALVKLHQRLVATAAGGAAAAAANGGGGGAPGSGTPGGGAAPGANPFLAPPVVVDAADGAAGGGGELPGAAGPGDGGDDGLDSADFDTGAAQRVFRLVLPPEQRRRPPGAPGDAQQQDQSKGQQGGGGGAAAMDVDGQEGASFVWMPEADSAAGGGDGGGGGLRRQDLLQLRWHDPSKAASVLGAAARARPPDAYQERAEAAMAAENAAAGGRQRKSAYGRGNVELQRADELLRAGHAPQAARGAFEEDDDDDA